MADACGVEGLLDPPVAVGDHAEFQAGLTEPGKRLRGAVCQHRPEMTLLVHAAETVAHLAQGFPRNSAEQKQRLEVGCGRVVITASGGLHGTGSCGPVTSQTLAGQREPEGGADFFGQARVVKKDQGVPRVEQYCAKFRPRPLAQRKRSSPPKPSMATRASGS